MAISLSSVSLVSLLISLLSLSASASASGDLADELRYLRSTSPSGLIHLNDLLMNRILSLPESLPFSLVIFFDAEQLHNKPDLQLKTLRSEFALLSESFLANRNPENPADDLFFCDIEFRESQSTFSMFNINSLPHIRLIPASAANPKSDFFQMSPSDFSELAESMARFVESKTGIVVGPIHRPPLFSNLQKLIAICGFLILIPFMVKKLIMGQTLLHDWRFWLAGAVFVYFFSVSGAMFNIIRKMPMFMADRNNPSRLAFFYQGSGMQLGAEGFAIGSLYTVVGLLLAFMTHGLVRVKNENLQRLGMIVALFVSFWAVKQVVFLDNWKTGYGIHMYWPTSWR